MIVLDTNVLSEPLRPSPSTQVIEWLDRQHVETLHTTVFTVAELKLGVALLPQGRRREHLTRRLESEVLPLFTDRILPFDGDAPETWATLQAAVRAAGRALPAVDSSIAAICLAHGLPLATRNTRDFDGLGIDLVDPWAVP